VNLAASPGCANMCSCSVDSAATFSGKVFASVASFRKSMQSIITASLPYRISKVAPGHVSVLACSSAMHTTYVSSALKSALSKRLAARLGPRRHWLRGTAVSCGKTRPSGEVCLEVVMHMMQLPPFLCFHARSAAFSTRPGVCVNQSCAKLAFSQGRRSALLLASPSCLCDLSSLH
jgi:hypothetical protein